jgi:hypothetical protein
MRVLSADWRKVFGQALPDWQVCRIKEQYTRPVHDPLEVVWTSQAARNTQPDASPLWKCPASPFAVSLKTEPRVCCFRPTKEIFMIEPQPQAAGEPPLSSLRAPKLELDRCRGCLLGLACGDSIGTTLEFSPRDSGRPLTDMEGGGPFDLPAGAWTDDMSQALCLGYSLAERGFDARDQMDRYRRWYRSGYLSSTGACFDIGAATSGAIIRFERTGEPYSGSTDPDHAGNGSIMRLAPVVIYFFPQHDKVIF